MSIIISELSEVQRKYGDERRSEIDMSEDLDVVLLPDGSESFITMYGSACNKYIFGKFFFADYIAKINF